MYPHRRTDTALDPPDQLSYVNPAEQTFTVLGDCETHDILVVDACDLRLLRSVWRELGILNLELPG